MKESAWEASRRREKKKAFLFVVLLTMTLVVAFVLFLNNRDLIGPSTRQRSLQAEEHAAEAAATQAEAVSIAESAGSYPAAPVSPEAVSGDEQPIPAQGTSDSPTATPPLPSTGDAPATKKTAGSDHPKFFSIELPSFPCRIESRKDIVIHLSLELFFSDGEKRTAILLRRNDIRVMVERTVWDKELSEIKIGELETQLLYNINKLFDHPDIAAVKIRNVQVEKAFKQ
ncbi:MAG: hypothetical protein JXA18_17210 [Chitinispirillaceae bacterium]|nr:hypothetical protein [Chitinispirillaceae bacterium]